MSPTRDIFSILGLDGCPWIVRVYFVMLVLFMIFVWASAWPIVPERFGTLAADGLKTTLGALLGALSLAGDRRLRGSAETPGEM